MGVAYDAYEKSLSKGARLVDRIKKIRESQVEQPILQIASAITELELIRQEDARSPDPCFDADDIAIQNAAMQTLIDDMTGLIVRARTIVDGTS